MEKILKLIFVIIFVCFLQYIIAQNNDADIAYCFRFTWLGPKYHNESIIGNATCEDVIGLSKVPCVRPLVASNNSNLPDTNAMWDMWLDRSTNVVCRLSRGDVCVKYSYYYNNAVENITYMCTKVNIENEGAVTSGCFSEFHQNGREVEVCVCETTRGSIPCNSAYNIYSSIQNLIIYLLFVMFILVVSI